MTKLTRNVFSLSPWAWNMVSLGICNLCVLDIHRTPYFIELLIMSFSSSWYSRPIEVTQPNKRVSFKPDYSISALGWMVQTLMIVQKWGKAVDDFLPKNRRYSVAFYYSVLNRQKSFQKCKKMDYCDKNYEFLSQKCWKRPFWNGRSYAVSKRSYIVVSKPQVCATFETNIEA